MSVLASEAARLDTLGVDDRPLTDPERALLIRLLSDPFSFPITFKTWLISFIESSDILLPRSSIEGLNFLLGSEGGKGVFGLLPAGLIFPFGGLTAPEGAFLCNGAAYSRAAYKRLFDVIGTSYGAPSGDTFSVPDLRRRVLWGYGASTTLGQNEGEANDGSRSIDHYHDWGPQGASGTTELVGDHVHPTPAGGGTGFMISQWVTAALGSGGSSRYIPSDVQEFSGPAGLHGHNVNVTVPAGPTTGGHKRDHPAYIVLNFLINY